MPTKGAPTKTNTWITFLKHKGLLTGGNNKLPSKGTDAYDALKWEYENFKKKREKNYYFFSSDDDE